MPPRRDPKDAEPAIVIKSFKEIMIEKKKMKGEPVAGAEPAVAPSNVIPMDVEASPEPHATKEVETAKVSVEAAVPVDPVKLKEEILRKRLLQVKNKDAVNKNTASSKPAEVATSPTPVNAPVDTPKPIRTEGNVKKVGDPQTELQKRSTSEEVPSETGVRKIQRFDSSKKPDNLPEMEKNSKIPDKNINTKATLAKSGDSSSVKKSAPAISNLSEPSKSTIKPIPAAKSSLIKAPDVAVSVSKPASKPLNANQTSKPVTASAAKSSLNLNLPSKNVTTTNSPAVSTVNDDEFNSALDSASEAIKLFETEIGFKATDVAIAAHTFSKIEEYDAIISTVKTEFSKT